MTNMRRGFTMIELVFVIVIIGILAAVALPRFTGIADDARTSKLQAFVGTLNKTVGPTIWSSIQRKYPAAQGSVASAALPATSQYNTIFITQFPPANAAAGDAQVETIPEEFAQAAAGQIDISACNLPTTGATDVQIVGGARVATATIGTSNYAVTCSPGSLAAAPHFYLIDTDDSLVIVR